MVSLFYFIFLFKYFNLFEKLHEILIEVHTQKKIIISNQQPIFYRKLDKHEFRFKKYFFFVRMLAGYHIVCIDMT